MKQTERSTIFIPEVKGREQIDIVYIHKWKHRYLFHGFHIVAERR